MGPGQLVGEMIEKYMKTISERAHFLSQSKRIFMDLDQIDWTGNR